MSAIKRVVSGSLASWLRIVVTIMSQIIAVPVYLSYWSIETYGIWILVQSIITFLTIFDVAHHQYLGNEFLKLGKQKRAEITEVFGSGIVTAFIISIVTFTAISIMVVSGVLGRWVEVDALSQHEFEISLLLMAGTWGLTVTFTGLLGRVLYPFGYFPLSAWSGVVFALVSIVASMLAVCLGAGLIGTTLVTCTVNLVCHSILALVLLKIARDEKLISRKINLSLGFSRFFASLVLGVQYGLEIIRQQGVRFILLPMSGMTQMIAFSTMRTGANLAQQGLATITSPLMPELMSFLSSRDQHRTEVAFSVIWLMLCVVLVPAVLILQYLAPILFMFWTHGKIAFNPGLFGLLSLGVLVSALAQPSIAVVNGNNMLKQQLTISLCAAFITVGGLYFIVPRMGIMGAAIALLLGEVTSMMGYVYSAKQWLLNVQMQWPQAAFARVSLSLWVAIAGMASITIFTNYAELCLMLALIAQGFVIRGYWAQVPLIARQQVAGQLARVLPGTCQGWLKKSIKITH